MPLKSIEMRLVVQITFRLIKIRWPCDIHYVLLLIGCHYQLFSIVLGHAIHFLDLHESLSSFVLSKFCLEFVENGVIVWNLLMILTCYFFLCCRYFYQVDIVILLNCSALSTLLKITKRRLLSSWLIRRDALPNWASLRAHYCRWSLL